MNTHRCDHQKILKTPESHFSTTDLKKYSLQFFLLEQPKIEDFDQKYKELHHVVWPYLLIKSINSTLNELSLTSSDRRMISINYGTCSNCFLDQIILGVFEFFLILTNPFSFLSRCLRL